MIIILAPSDEEYYFRYEILSINVIQSTPLNRVTLVPEHFDPIKRNLGVDPIKRSELILFLWFCPWPSDPINRWPKLNR